MSKNKGEKPRSKKSRSKKPPVSFNVFGAYTKKKKETELERLNRKVDQADQNVKIAFEILSKAIDKFRKGELSSEDLEPLEQKYEKAKEVAEDVKRSATVAAIAKRKANENAALEAALERIEENRERNEEEAEKRTAIVVPTMKTEAQKAFEKEFEEKEAAKTAAKASRMTKRNAERMKQETRKLRVNNIAGHTSVKRKNVEALLNNVNAQGLELNSDLIAHIITLAHKANVNVEEVLLFQKSKLVYDSEEEAIAFLKLVQNLDLHLETFLSLIERKKIPFTKLVTMLKNVPTNYLSEAEVVHVLELAYMAGVPVFIAIDLFEEEGGRSLTNTQKVNLMRLAYLSTIPMKKLFHHFFDTNGPFNDWSNELSLTDALNQLKQMKKDKKTFVQIIEEREEQEEKARRNMEALLKLKKSPVVNRTMLINTINKTKKAERPTYKSVAAKRIDEVKDTYTGLKVNNLPIKDIVIHSKKDLNAIADILRGCFRSGIFGKKKGIPEIKTVYIPLEKGFKFPKGYAFIVYQTHEGAKRALDHMKNPETKKPTFGKTGYEIKGKDVAPAYGEEFFKYANDKA